MKGFAEHSIKVDVHVDTVPVTMELDTGAVYTIISKETWKRLFPTMDLEEVDLPLVTYTGERLTVIGQAFVQVEYERQKFRLPLIVVDGQGPPLFGRNWLKKIQLNWMSIKQVSTRLEQNTQKVQRCFPERTGHTERYPSEVGGIRECHTKVFQTALCPLRDSRGYIEKDLERLESLGGIEKVGYSDWAAPIVPVPKADGSVRICGSIPFFKLTSFQCLSQKTYSLHLQVERSSRNLIYLMLTSKSC